MTLDWDVFISHASEDKNSFVRPLAIALIQKGIRVWFDEHSLHVGDSIRRGIEFGLKSSRFGIIVISPAFLEKEWPQKELDYFFTAETTAEYRILPIWHNVTSDDIHKKLPLLADRVAISSSLGLESVVSDLVAAIKSKSEEKIYRV